MGFLFNIYYMAINYAAKYNPSQTVITGCTQVGNIAVSTNMSITNLSGFSGGVEDANGYIIISDTVNAGLVGRSTANKVGVVASTPSVPTYWRSLLKTDVSFLTLSNKLPARKYQTAFTTGTDAKTWLNSNGYWTSWVLPYTAGLFKTTYTGYFNDVVSFFSTATPQAFGANPATSVQTTAISEPGTDDGSSFSCQWLGYFKPTTTETYTFYTSSDDASYAWIGDNAITGFTTTNAIVKNGGLHGTTEQSGTIALTAGVYYPIRIQFGELSGGDVLTFNFSTPTISKTTNVTGLVFYNAATNNFFV
jgi:hypothetical protein